MTDSKAEFCSAILERLRKDGVLEKITASIRSRKLKLLLNEKESSSKPASQMHQQSIPLLWLLYHCLEQNGFTHTLSVFATESRLEHSIHLSATEAMKEIGLQEIWTEISETLFPQPVDVNSSLQAVVRWITTLREKRVAMDTDFTAHKNHVQVSTSFQTNEGSRSHTCYYVGNESECNNVSRGICDEFSIIEIERECQRRMRQEMNEKLRLSAKKQAVQAARRLEQKHKEALHSLYNQIEVERAHAKRREDELTKELSQQQVQMHQERELAEQRHQTIMLEMQSQQREMNTLNERVKLMQTQRFNEWTSDHDVFQRKSLASLDKLHDDKRKLHTQMHAVAMREEEIRSKELQFASTTQEKLSLLAEIKDLRHRQTASLALQQSSFDYNLSKTKAELVALQKKYNDAIADLDLSRNEVAGLHALLKQSQAAIESVSFREIGLAGVVSPLASCSRSSMRPSLQLGLCAQPNVSTNLGSASILHDAKERLQNPHLRKTESSSHQKVIDSKQLQTNIDLVQIPHNLNSLNAEISSHQLNSVVKKPKQGIDPPCTASEDPPEIKLSKSHDRDDMRQSDDGAIGKKIEDYAGNEFPLNISSITDDVKKNEIWAINSIQSIDQLDLPTEPSSPESSHIAIQYAILKENADKNNHNQQKLNGAQLVENLDAAQLFDLVKSIGNEIPSSISDDVRVQDACTSNSLRLDKVILPTERSSSYSISSSRGESRHAALEENANKNILSQPKLYDAEMTKVILPIDRKEEFDHELKPIYNEVASENICLHEAHQSVPTSDEMIAPAAATTKKSQRSLASIFDSELNSKQFQKENEDNYLPPILVGSKDDNSKYSHAVLLHDTNPISYELDEVDATAIASNCQRSIGSRADSEPYSENFHTWDEEFQLPLAVGEIDASKIQRHRYADGASAKGDEIDSDKPHCPHATNQAIYDSDDAHTFTNNLKGSAASIADSEQYSEQFFTVDEGNDVPSSESVDAHAAKDKFGGNRVNKSEKDACPCTPFSTSSENYSDQFSYSSDDCIKSD